MSSPVEANVAVDGTPAAYRLRELVALSFVPTSFLMVLVLSAFYIAYGGLPWMRGDFYGIGAAGVVGLSWSTAVHRT